MDAKSDEELRLLASEEKPQRPKAIPEYLRLPIYFWNPTIMTWDLPPKFEHVLCMFVGAYPCCRHFVLSMDELKDSGDLKPALWSVVLVLAAAQAVARSDKLYLLFWGDSLIEDFFALVITGLALGYTLTTGFLFAPILFGFNFFKTVLLIRSRLRNPQRELPSIMPRWRLFHHVAIRWVGSVICVAFGALPIPWWWLPSWFFSSIGEHPFELISCEGVLRCFFVFYAMLLVALFRLTVWSFGILLFFVPFPIMFLFLSVSANVFSLSEFHLMTQEGCCSNVRSRLMVLLCSHAEGVEEVNRLFLDLVAVVEDPAPIEAVLVHGAQVDAQGSLGLRMACDPDGPERSRRRADLLSYAPRTSNQEAMAPIVRCLMDRGATPPPGCAVGSLSVGTVSCLAEYGHLEALHHPRTFAHAVLCRNSLMVEYLILQGADVDAGIREACALRGRNSTLAGGLLTVFSNIPAEAPTPFTDDTLQLIRQGDPEATAVLLLNETPLLIEVGERESIALSCFNSRYRELATEMLIREMISVESEAAEEILIHAAITNTVTTLTDQLGSVQLPKRALNRGVVITLADDLYESAKTLLQLGASLPVGYEEEAAQSGNLRRIEFVREVIEMDATALTKAAR